MHNNSFIATVPSFLQFFPLSCSLLFFVATFSCEWWLWTTDDVTTMIIHYILYCNLRDLQCWRNDLESVPISNETHMKNSLLWINEWWLIEARFCVKWITCTWHIFTNSESTNPRFFFHESCSWFLLKESCKVSFFCENKQF